MALYNFLVREFQQDFSQKSLLYEHLFFSLGGPSTGPPAELGSLPEPPTEFGWLWGPGWRDAMGPRVARCPRAAGLAGWLSAGWLGWLAGLGILLDSSWISAFGLILFGF